MICRILIMCLLFTGYFSIAIGQVTSSFMNGYVSDGIDSLPGATVIVTHIPSGSRYSTITNKQGYYQLQGMRPGGPYKVEISYVGFHGFVVTGIQLRLAEAYTCNAILIPSTTLDEVIVRSTKSKY